MTGEAETKNEAGGVVTAGCLRRMLYDLEAGRIVRVALDLQALIQQLEGSVDLPAGSGSRDRDLASHGGLRR